MQLQHGPLVPALTPHYRVRLSTYGLERYHQPYGKDMVCMSLHSIGTARGRGNHQFGIMTTYLLCIMTMTPTQRHELDKVSN